MLRGLGTRDRLTLCKKVAGYFVFLFIKYGKESSLYDTMTTVLWYGNDGQVGSFFGVTSPHLHQFQFT